MPNITPELREALKKYVPRFVYDKQAATLTNLSGYPTLLDLRGWGYLTGQGALNLPEAEAEKIQDVIGTYLAACLNEAVKEERK